ncbi:MAG: hypothetical protein HRT82_16940 [Henriciella sp.]|nr:hypothetical protein [Henriciella sp.]
MRADMKAEQDLYAIIPGVALLHCDTVQDPDSLYGGYSQFVGYLGTTSTEEVVKGPYYSYFCNEISVSENGRSVKSRLGYPGKIVVSGLWRVTDAAIEIGAKIRFRGGPRGAMYLDQGISGELEELRGGTVWMPVHKSNEDREKNPVIFAKTNRLAQQVFARTNQ